MRARFVRFLTALAVVGLCALAVSRGWDIVRFSMADAGLQAEAVRPWVAVSGLSFSAQESLLTDEADPGDEKRAQKRRNELTDILAVRPLSSEYWLALSEIRLVTLEPSNKVVEAFELSTLTGANEDYMMARRGVFGVSHWEVLPAEVRMRAATDLVAGPLSDRTVAKLRTALSGKTETVRQEIRTALEAEGLAPKELARISL